MKKCIRVFLSSLLMTAILLAWTGTVCEAAQQHFPDVTNPKDYYFEAVDWAITHNITTGRGGCFKPGDTCTRAEAVTFLYRLAGSPDVSGSCEFADVQDPGLWCYKAVIWAAGKGITSGYGEVNGQPVFRPGVTCSRAMIVTLIKRFAQNVRRNYRAPAGTGKPFPDVAENAWYAETVHWAAQNGVTNGKGDGRFHPGEGCTRAQIVTFLYRYSKLPPDSGDIELPEVPA